MKPSEAEKIIDSVQGNLKHEDMILTDAERAFLKEYILGHITREEYIQKALEME